MNGETRTLLCPSSRPESAASAVFAIVDDRGPFPIIRYLPKPIDAGLALRNLDSGENPFDVFRFTSPCQEDRCTHFREGECGLPRWIQSRLPPSGVKVEHCPIRSDCRWFHQLPFHACTRCAAIVTGEFAAVDQRLEGPLDRPKQQAANATAPVKEML